MIAEMCALVDRVRSCGIELTAAGKGMVAKDQIVGFDDVELVKDLDGVGLRREMERKAGA
jgi:predicted homoserine dehydrogenase-like protein